MRTIVLGYDDSDAARSALLWSAREARDCGTELHVVHVISSAGTWQADAAQADTDAWRREREDLLRDTWTKPLRSLDVAHRATVEVGDPAETIAAIARRDRADAVVVGGTGRGRVAEAVLGSVAGALVRDAGVPVVVVPAHLPERAPG